MDQDPLKRLGIAKNLSSNEDEDKTINLHHHTLVESYSFVIQLNDLLEKSVRKFPEQYAPVRK